MKTFKSILAAAAAGVLAVCATQAASAAPIAHDLGLINAPGISFFANPAPIGGNGDIYEFDFSTANAWKALFQMQTSNSGPDPIQFHLDKWIAPHTYQLVAASGYATGADLPLAGTMLLGPGQYRLMTDQIGLPSGDKGILSGAVGLSAVPEPATWAMLSLGLGLVGFAARRRRAATVVAA